VHDDVASLGLARIRRRFREIADDRVHTASGNRLRFAGIADERGYFVAGAKKTFEGC
jgi:hypothetical protein